MGDARIKILDEAAMLMRATGQVEKAEAFEGIKCRIAALEAECDVWKDVARKAGVCMTCALRAPEPYGCTDCLNTGWRDGAPPGFVHAEVVTALTKGGDADG